MRLARHRTRATQLGKGLDPYQRVALHVLAQAMDDADDRQCGEAMAFLSIHDADFRFWCEVLGVAPGDVVSAWRRGRW